MTKFTNLFASILFLFLLVSCVTLQSRDEQETKMLALLNTMAPLAQEIIDINKFPQKMLEKARANDKAGVHEMQKDSIGNYYRKQNIMTELQPYQNQFNYYKYEYIRNFGTIEYNGFIKKNNLSWGLGIYW